MNRRRRPATGRPVPRAPDRGDARHDGLARQRPCGRHAGGSCPGAADAEHAAQQVRHHESRVGADHIGRLAAILFQQVAVAILDREHLERFHPHALVRERGIGAGHLHECGVACAERDRQVGRKVLFEPEPLRVLQHGLRPERVHHPDCRDVPRFLERVAQRDRS